MQMMSERREADENPLIEVTRATAPGFLSDCPGDRLGSPDGGKGMMRLAAPAGRVMKGEDRRGRSSEHSNHRISDKV